MPPADVSDTAILLGSDADPHGCMDDMRGVCLKISEYLVGDVLMIRVRVFGPEGP